MELNHIASHIVFVVSGKYHHIIGITESWAYTDITDAELGLTGYVVFRRDRIGRRGGGVILYVKESIQAYEIKLERVADYDEAVWC